MGVFVREIYFLFRNRDLFLEENDLNLDTKHSRQRRMVLTRLILTKACMIGDAGILVLVNNQLRVPHQNVALPGRIINFGVKSGEDNFDISAVYGYTGVKANRENLALMTGLLSERHEMSHLNMVLGDFNFVDDDLDRTNSRKLGMNPTDKILSPVWTEFTNKIDISDP